MDILLRVSAIYVLLWVVTKGMGKRELAQMSSFELILLVAMGDLIQQGATQDDRSVTGAALAIIGLTFWVMITAFVSNRFRPAQDVLEGIPVVVVRDGVPVEEAMRLERVNLDDVAGAARRQGIGDLRAIRVGVLEPEGGFSFVLFDGSTSQASRTSPDMNST
jgi:uncharacterized membrane protein YcaP (DUF421 family)